MRVTNNSMFTAIQRMQKTPNLHNGTSFHFDVASAQKSVTELNSGTNDPMLCAKLTVQHTT